MVNSAARALPAFKAHAPHQRPIRFILIATRVYWDRRFQIIGYLFIFMLNAGASHLHAESAIETELKQALIPLASYMRQAKDRLGQLEKSLKHLKTEDEKLRQFEVVLIETIEPLKSLRQGIWELEGKWLDRLAGIRLDVAEYKDEDESAIHDDRLAALDKQFKQLKNRADQTSKRLAARYQRRKQVMTELIWIKRQKRLTERVRLNWQVQQYEVLANLSLVIGDMSSQLTVLEAHLNNVKRQTNLTQLRLKQQRQLDLQRQLSDSTGVPMITQSLMEMNRALKGLQMDNLTVIRSK